MKAYRTYKKACSQVSLTVIKIQRSDRLVWPSLMKGSLIEKMGFNWILRILSYVDDYVDKMNLHIRVEWQPEKVIKYMQRYSPCMYSCKFFLCCRLEVLSRGASLSWAPALVKLKNWCFWTVVLEKILDSPLDCKEIKPKGSNPKGNQSWIFIERTDAEAKTPILWPTDAKNWLLRKDPDAGKDWKQEEGTRGDEMVGWHQWLDGHGFEQAPGFGDGQGGLACCSQWGHKELDATELNWTSIKELSDAFIKKIHQSHYWVLD